MELSTKPHVFAYAAARGRMALLAAAAGAAVLTGCATLTPGGPASPIRPSVAPATPTATAPVPPTAPASPTAPTSPPATAVPVLGRPAGVFAHGTGFGHVKPARIFNGGDPTGLVTHVVWRTWGHSRAVGSGVGYYDAPNQPVFKSKAERVSVVAFHLGDCHGTLMYQAVEWFFPQHGQSFDASRYENICAGTYVGQ
jgi:hypothetical protein